MIQLSTVMVFSYDYRNSLIVDSLCGYFTTCCLFLLFVAIIMIIYYLIKPGRLRVVSWKSKQCPNCGIPLKYEGERCPRCGGIQTEEKKTSSFFSKFTRKGKKRCEECDVEMIRQEEIDAWYCPSCRTYK
ncbi:MAG: hypothetical protein R6U17_01320 [Thermoplasmata archaeon]